MAYASKEWTEKYLGTTLKAAREEGLLVNGTDFVPVGTIIPFMGVKAPKDYLICDGAEYQISSYSDLASFIERQFGTVNHFGGDGTTTFAVPDLRGEFLRGTGANSHANQGSGASVGTHQDGTENLYLGVNQKANGDLWFQSTAYTSEGTSAITEKGDSYITKPNSGGLGSYWHRTGTFSGATGQVSTTSRPTNTSVLYCIKATNASEVNVTNNYLGIDRYTDKEICIGEYMGKPLYRKILFESIPTATTRGTLAEKRIPLDIPIDTVIHMEANWFAQNDKYSYGSSGYQFDKISNTVFYENSRKLITIGNSNPDWNGSIGFITIEYTKTTDADDSFTPSMIDNNISIGGVAYTDYSEEERVTGKWINGKPVYRKVYPATIPATTKDGTFAIGYIPLDNDVDTVISWTGRVGSQPLMYVTNAGYQLKTYVEVSSKRLAISNSVASFSNQSGYIVVEYTKSTDAPDSFKPSMVLGGVSIEEASDEDVKEVW